MRFSVTVTYLTHDQKIKVRVLSPRAKILQLIELRIHIWDLKRVNKKKKEKKHVLSYLN